MMTFFYKIILILTFLFFSTSEASQPSKAIVVTANNYASEAAAKIIKRGGTAADAAVTAQLILTMTTPQSTGIGGGGFILYWDNFQKKLYAIDGREVAPKSANPNLFINNNKEKIKFYPDAVISGKSVGVPGLLKLMEVTHERFGKLNWEDLFIEPIKIAEEGFIVSKALNNTLQFMKHMKNVEPAASFYFKTNALDKLEPIKVGSILKNEEFAKTLKRISKLGVIDFYEGKTSQLIIDAIESHEDKSNLLTAEDLKN